tara:strand:- start:8038 stop:9876 length:1839 start_codon:yes stop_codon:yes gene_type:complete
MKIGNLNMQYTNKSFKVLSISYGHESNASLMINGKLISSVAEERFTKKKCQMGYPKNSINFCLNNSNLKPNDLDQIAIVSKNDMMEQNIVGRIDSFSIEDFLSEQYDYWWPIIYKKKKVDYLEIFKHKINLNQNFKFKNFLKIRKKFKKKTVRIKYFQKLRINTVVEHLKIKDIKKIIHVDHEKGHQYYALFASPKKYRKNCLILTNEGMGDKSNLSVSVVKNEKLKEVFFSKKNRIGTLYKFMTLLLGMKPSQHEYKVMGLAPYASEYETKKAYNAAFKDLFKANGFGIDLKKKPKDFFFDFQKKLRHCRFDGIAGGLQKVVEETLVQWIKNCIKKTKINKVILTGGVAQNIKTAIPISEIKELSSFYINPTSGDATLSVGGCYYISQLNKQKNIEELENIYLGPQYDGKKLLDIIKKFSKKNKNFKFTKIKNNKAIVNLLKNGKILGRFNGRMEMGQRSLGNRSIIADPRKLETIKLINSKIKMRDFWMPFTPTILKKYEKKYLINKKNLYCPYMSMAFRTTDLFQKIAPATIHPADQTTRPQILERKNNYAYYDLINDFGRSTGVYCLLNTSLNIHGYPLACSPHDALFTLKNSQLDGLIFEKYLILRI